jgi:peptide/nickel transport system substrate-binding protein
MRSTPNRLLALVLATALMATAACTSAAPGGNETAGPPRRGGTLTYLLSGELISLDPVTFSVPSNPSLLAPRALAVFDALALDNPQTGALEMRIAESMTSTDSLMWTVKLHPGVRFSDGTPLDAAAVRFNWLRTADPANRSPMAPYARQMASLDVTDAQTLSVRLTVANASFPRMVARYLTYIGSPTAIQSDPSAFGTRPVGAGPYVVKEFVRDDHLTLDRNPTYYGTTYLDRIVIRPVVDETQRFNTLSTGEADAMFSSDPNTAEQARGVGFGHIATTLNGGSDIMFNVTRPPFDDRRARQAIALALDGTALNRDLYRGLGQPSDSLFASTSPFYDPAIRQATPNREQAQALLDTLVAEGKPVKVTFLVPQSFSARAEWFQAQLATYRNIEVHLQTTPDAQTSGIASAGNFQAAFLASTWLYPDPAMSAFFGTKGTQNWGRYSNPAVDAALARAHVTTDEARLRAAYAEVQKAIVQDIPSVFYFRPTYLVIHSRNVHGLSAVGDGSPLWTSIWLSKG